MYTDILTYNLYVGAYETCQTNTSIYSFLVVSVIDIKGNFANIVIFFFLIESYIYFGFPIIMIIDFDCLAKKGH
jgi:hypothetical protein